MKQFLTIIIGSILLVSCSTTPQEYFGKAALNCNTLFGFAGDELSRDMAQPGVKLVDANTMATAPITRKEWVEQKLNVVEQQYAQVKSLSSNAAANSLLLASKALYEWVLPVYRKEYKELAELYDSNAPADRIEQKAAAIHQQYHPQFLALYEQVLQTGKAYAAQNGIRVQEVNPSPTR